MSHSVVQGSSEVFFRRVKFWDKEHSDAPPVFIVEGVSYLHIKVPPDTWCSAPGALITMWLSGCCSALHARHGEAVARCTHRPALG